MRGPGEAAVTESSVPTRQPGASPALPQLPGAEIWSQLHDSAPAVRFEIVKLLGLGSTSQVYAVADRSLQREVAVKVLDERVQDQAAIRSFVEEAQLTATLDHTNIPPVFDVDISDGGRPYFSTRRVEGRTLGDLIEISAPGGPAAGIDSPNAIVSRLIAVCNAIAYAHHQGIVHQDIKPENILIGAFGEVLVLDWGCAARVALGSQTTAIYGTPLYMSPEQARRERVDRLSDIYCIGATLFHTLLLRAPMWSADNEEFWKRKCAGSLDLPTREERQRVPAELIAIALMAMAPRPQDRYATVEALRDDLERWQTGQPVRAHRYSAQQRFRRWLRRHHRTLVIWGAVGSAFLTLIVILCGERLKEVATWGRPVVDEEFADDAWRSRWLTFDGGFERRNGALVSTGTSASRLLLPQRFTGATAIEYDATILPNSRACDVSVYWSRGFRRDDTGAISLDHPFGIKIGAFENSFTEITDEPTVGDYSGFRLEVGRTYRVRIEIVDCSIGLWIDGKQTCRYQHPFPLTGGYVSLFAYYPGKAYRHFRIYSLGEPQRLPATALGDLLAERGEYADAAERFARVVDSQPGTALSDEALYRQGLCLYEAGMRQQAYAAWMRLRDPLRREQADLHRLLDMLDASRFGALMAAIALDYPHASDAARVTLINLWNRAVDVAMGEKDLKRCSALVDLHDRLFADAPVADIPCANALDLLGRDQEVIDRFPDLTYQRADALSHLERYEDILRDYADHADICALTLFQSARYDELTRLYPENYFSYEVLVNSGRYDQAYKLRPLDARLLLQMGRLEEAAATPKSYWQVAALIQLGRSDEISDPQFQPQLLMAKHDYAEVVARFPASGEAQLVPLLQALDRAIQGDPAPLRSYAQPLHLVNDGRIEHELDVLLIAHAAIDLIEHRHTIDQMNAEILGNPVGRWWGAQRFWYCARLATGRISDEAFRSQPYQCCVDAQLELLRGITEDCAGHGAGALAYYRRWTQLPQWRRSLEQDPLAQEFVAWRMRTLSR